LRALNAAGDDPPQDRAMNASRFTDAYAPAEMMERVEAAGVDKAAMPLSQLFTLALLGGAFIAFGAMLYTVVVTDAQIGWGPMRLLGGVAFSLGLVLVLIGGAELFTGNMLLVMAWADGRISVLALLRNWAVVYVGNLVGAVATAVLVMLSNALGGAAGAVAETAVDVASSKVALGFGEAVARGVLCNVLVCLAVWLSYATTNVAGRILAIMFPVAAFVALGLEHSVANMYLIPQGWLAGAAVAPAGYLANLLFVTLGNVAGGAGGVSLAYWLAYRDAKGA
jgi:formate/nitrite transporter